MSRSTVSDSSGHRTVVGLPSGNYQVKLESHGFQTSMNNIRYDSSQPSLYQGVLSVGAVAETIEVTAQTVSVGAQSAEVSCSPLNGRNFSRIMPLAPWGRRPERLGQRRKSREAGRRGSACPYRRSPNRDLVELVRPLVLDEETKVTFSYKSR